MKSRRQAALDSRCVTNRVLVFGAAVAIGLAVAGSVPADENVRAVQEKLRDGGFYSGEIDGAYSSQLSAALTRYQIRNGLPITGQLDLDTSKALDAKPAVTKSAASSEQSSETWRRLRRGEQHTSAKARETPSPRARENLQSADSSPPQASSPAHAPISSESARPVSAPPATASDTSSSTAGGVSAERLHDYVGAFVLAGLDPQGGSEADFFADHVQYYDQGVMDRENIRKDLRRYSERWPERRFWIAGDIRVKPQNGNRMQVTFPLRYELRNGSKHSSGKIDKTLVLEPVGEDLQIVAVNERPSE